MRTILFHSNREKLLDQFRKHLLTDRGLAARTCFSRVFYVREFLQTQQRAWRRRPRDEGLTPEVLLGYLLGRSRQDSPERLQSLATALRSFCRFLQLSGRIGLDLTVALPRIGSDRAPGLPDYLSRGQLRHLLSSTDTGTPAGMRNHAIMLCLARLGLRAGEVARLTLDQIDWRAGVLRLSPGKGRRERELPLPGDAGRAMAKYLHQRPQPASSRQVFCAVRNTSVLSSQAISQIARRALQQAGLNTPRPGAHLLRRTLASHLVQQGVSLKAVADLLGHRSLDTTRLYTHVNHAWLREVSRPWPTEAKR